jgi:hypothetical protein
LATKPSKADGIGDGAALVAEEKARIVAESLARL